MDSSLLALHYLPSVSWFVIYHRSSEVCIEHCESFLKSTYRNRCNIAGAAGNQTLTIPIKGGRDHHQLYRDTLMAQTDHWQKKHWHSIKAAYASTPFFDYYGYRLEKFYEQTFENLFLYNLELLELILKLLKTEARHRLTETFDKKPELLMDYRYNKELSLQLPRYYQIFSDRNGFIPNLSIIDLLFHLGPEAKEYLLNTELNAGR
jgi:hypothetical protein